MGKYQFVFLVK